MNGPQFAVTIGGFLAVTAISVPGISAQSQRTKSTVAYREVDGHRILADIERPQGDRVVPVIVWIHGGGLIMGHRESIDPKVRELAEERDYALVSIDYRLAPETKLPAIIGDIEAAFRWLAGDGARQFHWNTDRIAVAGASAGGYLTLMTGYRVEPRPCALVALYGYGGLIDDWYAKPSPHPRHNVRQVSAEEAAGQTDGSVVSDSRQRTGNGGLIYLHYRQHGIWPREVTGFDAESLAAKISPFEPVRHVTPQFPPTLLIHGTRDTDVPYDQSTQMAEQLRLHHVPFVLQTIENGEHGLHGGDPQEIQSAYQAMREFIAEHLDSR